MSTAPPPPAGRQTPFERTQTTPEFMALRRRFRRFVFPLTATFLVWYFAFVLLAAYATDLLAIKVTGNINVGLLLGLGQFVTTGLVAWAYVRWADRRLDPAAAHLRHVVETAPTDPPEPTGSATASATPAGRDR